MRYIFLFIFVIGCGQPSKKDSDADAEKTANIKLLEALPFAFANQAALPVCETAGFNHYAFVEDEKVFKVWNGTAWEVKDWSAEICKVAASAEPATTGAAMLVPLNRM